jgi:hypothetical protein
MFRMLGYDCCPIVLFLNTQMYTLYKIYIVRADRPIMFSWGLNNISVISWRSVLLVEETGVPGENHRPVASHWQTLSYNVVSSTTGH